MPHAFALLLLKWK